MLASGHPCQGGQKLPPYLNGLGRQCALRGADSQHLPASRQLYGVLASAHQPEVWGEAGLHRGCGSIELAPPELLCSVVRTLKFYFLFLQSFRKTENIN